jgi:hypothetical protein
MVGVSYAETGLSISRTESAKSWPEGYRRVVLSLTSVTQGLSVVEWVGKGVDSCHLRYCWEPFLDEITGAV